MVFEAVVTEVLNKVLGDYIENLDHKQLKIGIWGGELSAQSQSLISCSAPVLELYVLQARN